MLLSNKFNKTLLDLNQKVIKLTEQTHKFLNKDANFITADMFNMPLEDCSFDIVFNAGVIEHFSLEERISALHEYARVLKNDGIMYIAFPNHFSIPYKVAYIILRLFKKWPYPMEYQILNLKKEIKANNLNFNERIVLSKGSLFNWLYFSKILKNFFLFLDKFINFEGYLTVIKITKNTQ